MPSRQCITPDFPSFKRAILSIVRLNTSKELRVVGFTSADSNNAHISLAVIWRFSLSVDAAVRCAMIWKSHFNASPGLFSDGYSTIATSRKSFLARARVIWNAEDFINMASHLKHTQKKKNERMTVMFFCFVFYRDKALGAAEPQHLFSSCPEWPESRYPLHRHTGTHV